MAMVAPSCQSCTERAQWATPAKPLGAGLWSNVGRYCRKHKPSDAVPAYRTRHGFTSPQDTLNRLSPLDRRMGGSQP